MNQNSTHQCPSCYYQQAFFYAYCGQCGHAFSKMCSQCNKKSPAEFKFCGFCGLSFLNHPQTTHSYQEQPAVSPSHAPIQASTQPMAITPTPNMPASAVARMTEQRRVAILFCDLCGFTAMSEKLDAEDVSNVVHPLFEQISQVIHKYEGVIEKFIGDAIMAFFGVPISHEDDPERSLLAALEIRDIIKNYRVKMQTELGIDLNMRIGINVGNVVAGTVGNASTQEYTIMGDAINTAARVEQNARHGNILVTDNVYKITQDRFDFEPAEAIKAKGKSELIQVFELIDLKQHQQRTRGFKSKSIPFIGRKEELKTLITNEKALAEKVLFIGVEAEAGQGKSRLIKEWRNHLSDKLKITKITGSATSYSQKFSYFLLQSLLKNALNVHERTSQEDTKKALLDCIETHNLHNQKRSLQFLEYILFPNQITGQLKYLSAEHLKLQLFKALSDFFASFASKGLLVLTLEDLHWADHLSLEWLQFFQRYLLEEEQTHILLSATWRKQEHTDLGTLLPWHKLIKLTPLSAPESESLINAILDIEACPKHLNELYQTLLKRSEGNPYYIEEVMKELLHKDSLRLEGETWQLKESVKNLPLPSSLQSLTISHFDQLPSPHRTILQWATVIGGSFSLKMIQTLSEMSPKDLEVILSLLVQREYLWQRTEQGQAQFGFQKTLVQEIIYHSLLKKHKRIMHEKTGAFIEETDVPINPSESIEPLAQHFSKTNNTLKAVRYLYMAGQKSARLYASTLALEYYQKIIVHLDKSKLEPSTMMCMDFDCQEWFSSPQLRFKLYESKIDIYWLTGNYDTALKLCEQALEEHPDVAPALKARIYLQQGRILEKQAQWQESLQTLETGKTLLKGLEHSSEMAQFWNALGWLHYRMKSYEKATEAADKALVILSQKPDMEEIAYAHNILGVVSYQNAQWEKASQSYKKSLAIQKQINDEWGAANSLSNMGSVFTMTNRWKEACEHFNLSLDIRKRLGDQTGVATSCNNLGHIYQQMGDYDQAAKVMGQALQIYLKLKNKFGYAIAYCNLGLTHIQRQSWPMAIDNLLKGIEYLKELKADEILPEAGNGLIEVYLAQNEWELAQEWVINIRDQVKKYADPLQKGRYERFKGEYHLQKGHIKKALNYLKKAQGILEGTGNTTECIHIYHQLYRCYLLQKDERSELWLKDFETLLATLGPEQQAQLKLRLKEPKLLV